LTYYIRYFLQFYKGRLPIPYYYKVFCFNTLCTFNFWLVTDLYTPTTLKSDCKTTLHKSREQWIGTARAGQKIITCLICQRLEESAYYILIIFGTRVSQNLKASNSTPSAVNKFVNTQTGQRGGCRISGMEWAR